MNDAGTDVRGGVLRDARSAAGPRGSRGRARAATRVTFIALGLLVPLNLPFSIPSLRTDRVFGWSGSVAAASDEAAPTVITRTTRPGREAGLSTGDVLLEIDGEPAGAATLARVRRDAAVGDTLVLRVQRGTRVIDVPIVVTPNLASYVGYIGYRALVVVFAWVVGMGLLVGARGRSTAAVLMGAALVTLPAGGFPNGVPAEGGPLAAAQLTWQLTGAAHRTLFALLLLHFFSLYLPRPRLLASTALWAVAYGLALALLHPLTAGLVEPLAWSVPGPQNTVRAAASVLPEAAALAAALAVLRSQPGAGRLAWIGFAAAVYFGLSLAHAASLLGGWTLADPELLRRSRALLVGLVPAAVLFHFVPGHGERTSRHDRWLAIGAAAFLHVVYGSVVAATVLVVLVSRGAELGGTEWLLLLAVFAAAIGLSPVLRWARDILDRRIHQRWSHVEVRARDFVDGITAELDAVRVCARTAEALPGILGVETAELVLAGGPPIEPAAAPAGPEPPAGPFAPEAGGRTPHRGGGTVISALPVPVRDGEPAVLLLRERRGAVPLAAQELAIRRLVVDGLAAALRNAATYAALRRTQRELAEAERITALGTLAAGLAHEIKNPLASLRIGLHLLERDGVAPDRLERIRRDVGRIDDLVRGLLDRTARRGPGEACVDDLRAVAAACVEDVRALAVARDIRIVERYPAHRVAARAERVGLSLVVSNLLVNALEAVPNGGRVELAIATPPGGVEISVRDDGPGITGTAGSPPAAEPDGRRFGGSGLGLAIVRRVLQSMDGDIDVQPAVPHGTVLRVLLPRPHVSQTSPSAAAPGNVSRSPGTRT